MRDLLRELLRSLLNATLLLAVILTVSATLLVYKAESFTDDLIIQASTALLREAGHEVDIAIAAINSADNDLKLLTMKVSELVEKPGSLLNAKDVELLKGLRSDIEQTNRLIGEMSGSMENLSDRTIRRIARGIAEAIVSIPDCKGQDRG